MARLFGDCSDRSYQALMYKSSDIRKPRYKVIVLAAPIVPLSRGLTVIPIGFLYTQFPEQSSPQQLWPSLQWTEVTQQYAGLFFRAEGSGSLPFGQTQPSNQSWISDIWTYSQNADNEYGHYET